MTATTTPCADCIALDGQSPTVEPHGNLRTARSSVNLRVDYASGLNEHRVTYECQVCGAKMIWEDERTYPNTRWRLA